MSGTLIIPITRLEQAVWYRVLRLESLGGHFLAVVCMARLHSTTLGPRIILLQPNQHCSHLLRKQT